MHDAVWFESNNMPAVFVATDEFVDSAVAQSTSLGLPEVPRVYIPHPMQDQTDEEMWAKAEEALDKLLAALVRLSLIHISEPTRHLRISYAVFCLK